MDDILIAAKDKEECRERVKAVRHVLDNANVLINEGNRRTRVLNSSGWGMSYLQKGSRQPKVKPT